MRPTANLVDDSASHWLGNVCATEKICDILVSCNHWRIDQMISSVGLNPEQLAEFVAQFSAKSNQPEGSLSSININGQPAQLTISFYL